MHVLDDVQCSEKNELRLVGRTHALDERFQYFDDMFAVLHTISAGYIYVRGVAHLCAALRDELSYSTTSIFRVYHLCEYILTARSVLSDLPTDGYTTMLDAPLEYLTP